MKTKTIDPPPVQIFDHPEYCGWNYGKKRGDQEKCEYWGGMSGWQHTYCTLFKAPIKSIFPTASNGHNSGLAYKCQQCKKLYQQASD